MKILDCTLRDGGYYTNWDFDRTLVDTYITALNDLPIDYLEIGYRSIPKKGYLGEYFYLPVYVMERIKIQSNKKLVVILNEKDIRPEHVDELLGPCKFLIDMVRIAIDPLEFGRALKLAEAVKSLGFEVGFNVMYMSKWKNNREFLTLLPNVKGISDYFYMVDSYGGVYPHDVIETIQLVKSYADDIPLGFHGHNNLELALINTLTAIEEGCEIVDATITGMGRGAGNIKTELLLTVLNAQGKIDIDFNPLSKVVDEFSKLQKTYDWGTNLPYMISGVHSLPQKDVMDWVGKRFYSFNSIIRALNNQTKGVVDNENLSSIETESLKGKSVLIVGGGESVKLHKDAIIRFIENNTDLVIIHSSSKNAAIFKDLINVQIFCLVGNEGIRMESAFSGKIPKNIIGLLPPYPRKMGTYIPNFIRENSFQLPQNRFKGSSSENITSVVLELCYLIEPQEIFIAGYDGYSFSVTNNQLELFNENKDLFGQVKHFGIKSITPTKYEELLESSIYSLL